MSDDPSVQGAAVSAGTPGSEPETSAASSTRKPVHGSERALMLAALGIVFGDIGTSPLYAFHESVHHIAEPDPTHVLGILSLLFWSIVLVITVKYVALVTRADNDGEGGILALLALAPPHKHAGGTR